MTESNKSASLSEILCGLQQAVSNAVATLRAQQVNMLNTYIQDDGKPLTKTIVFGDKTVEVPLINRLSQNGISVVFCNEKLYPQSMRLKREDFEEGETKIPLEIL